MKKQKKMPFIIGERAIVEYNDLDIAFEGLVEGVHGTDVFVHLQGADGIIIVSTTTARIRSAV